MYHDHHNKDHVYYKGLASRFNVPILIISAINALTAVALNSFVPQTYVSIMNAILSSGTGVLGSVQLYLKISEKMTNSLRASILMKRLALKISKELSIDPEHRMTDGQAFLADCFAEFNTALEQGNPIEKYLHNHLAFTQMMPKREKYSFLSLVTGSSLESSSRGTSEHPGETRAKKLWGLVDKARKVSSSPPELRPHLRQSELGPGDMTPEEQDIELGVRGS